MSPPLEDGQRDLLGATLEYASQGNMRVVYTVVELGESDARRRALILVCDMTTEARSFYGGAGFREGQFRRVSLDSPFIAEARRL